MKLSELVFETVKNVKYLEEPNFNYDSFIRGEFDNDPDYANSINNVFAPLNEAIHRLSDRHKIKNRIEPLTCPDANGIVDLGPLSYDIKSIVNVFILHRGNYSRVSFREFGKDKILILNFVNNENYFIEFVQDIRNFNKNDIYFYEIDTEVLEQNDIDLKTYGISDTMCSYIIEYCQGKLLEPIAPELANMHLTRSEQYFDDLDEQQTSFTQQTITRKYRLE